MTTSVSGETTDEKGLLLAKLRDLVPSAFLDGELDRDVLLAALELGQPGSSPFAFTWPGIERARQDARAATSATLVITGVLPPATRFSLAGSHGEKKQRIQKLGESRATPHAGQ